ncbi:MAG TPA: SRPBCC family protein [Nocardioidaceae bacterium]|nr:SRPBCC family protein [Nocardioidaceae bacterium]
MAHAEMVLSTALSPDQVRAALLDFSENRPKVWPGMDPTLYEVFTVDETSAEIREGTKLPWTRVWARERYDWSDPNRIRWTVMESNFSVVGSYVEAALTPRADGGTDVHVTWERSGTTLVGKFAVKMIELTKGKPVADSMKRGFTKLEKQ